MSNTKKKVSKETKFNKYWKTPIKILIKARDFYIKGMSECSDRVGYGTMMGCPTGQVLNSLPRSLSVNSAIPTKRNEDYSELIRSASSKRGLNNKVDYDVSRRNLVKNREGLKQTLLPNKMPRSHSVGIGKIDEDKSYDFGEDNDRKMEDVSFRRSRSYAVTGRPAFY